MNAEASRPLAPGTLVGRYRILSSVGSGAMGEVYRAEDTSLGRVVALKTLPGDLVGTPDRRARFENEGRIMASLSHPNLVHVFDVGEHEGVPYLVQEFVEGETLEDVLLSGPVAAPKAARWIAQAAEGLVAAHEAGILHRDIKPSNLMVGRDGRIRVLDFGLAKVQSVPEDRRRSQPSLTTDGLVVGTAQYMSPEQASGKKVDARSDIFSLGIVFYELLAGKLPFEGETPVDVMYAILHLGHPPIPGFGSGVVRGFADVVDRALAKDPAQRFASMREMAAEIEAVLASGGWETRRARSRPPRVRAVPDDVGAAVGGAGLREPPEARALRGGGVRPRGRRRRGIPLARPGPGSGRLPRRGRRSVRSSSPRRPASTSFPPSRPTAGPWRTRRTGRAGSRSTAGRWPREAARSSSRRTACRTSLRPGRPTARRSPTTSRASAASGSCRPSAACRAS